MKRLLLAAIAAAAVLTALPEDSRAQGFGSGGHGFFGFGQSNIFDLYRSGRSPIPPYFALNPPVYYSYPVPRTYGYSPFYYPGDVRTPAIIEGGQPLEIINPYVPSSSSQSAERPAPESSAKAPRRLEPQPLIVENPFVTQDAEIYNVSH
ncbi:MAG: hypothetical protein AAGJ46_09600 [Planctomycetota bacterium]